MSQQPFPGKVIGVDDKPPAHNTTTTTSEHILQFFSYKHLPDHLAEVSHHFADLADRIVNDLPRNPERTVALRKLLEAKDAAVRAMVAK